MLHSKVKGTIGELFIAAELAKQGYPVFTELGDNSKVDLIALTPKPVRIQIKAITSKNGVVEVDSRKSGPNYKFRYSEDDADVFGIFILDEETVFFVSTKEMLTRKGISRFRLVPPKRGQTKNVRFVKDYRDFKRALRDYTLDTLTSEVEGDEIVQTTTS